MKQTVKDRYGNEIYLTDERWQHILDHAEMQGYRDRVLEVVRTGKRKQKPREPDKYAYSLPYDDMGTGFNTLVVIVKFGYNEDGSANNYVRTAYGVDDYSR